MNVTSGETEKNKLQFLTVIAASGLAVFQLHDLYDAHAIFLAFGYQQSSFKICQIMKVNGYQNCRITKSKCPMAMAIANVVRRLYRLNTDIIPSFFSMSRGFPSLYIFCCVLGSIYAWFFPYFPSF